MKNSFSSSKNNCRSNFAETIPIVALAASAGGLNAISQVLGGLPANFPAAIVVIQHLDPRHRSLMADILNKRTPLAPT